MRVAEALIIDGRALSGEPDEIISTLMDVLSVHVALVDLDEKRSHARMSSWWFSHELGTEDPEAAALNRAQNDDCVFVDTTAQNLKLNLTVGAANGYADGGIIFDSCVNASAFTSVTFIR